MDALFRRWTLASNYNTAKDASTYDADNRSSMNNNQCDDHEQQQQQSTTQATQAAFNKQPQGIDMMTDAEWIHVEEPVGFFFPEMQKRKQRLELDQVHNVLHYDRYRRVMRIHDISLVTSVEEAADSNGTSQWWMTIQDPHALQVWVLYFASRARLEHWVTRLRVAAKATAARAIVSDVVFASSVDRLAIRRRSSLAGIAIAVSCHQVTAAAALPADDYASAGACSASTVAAAGVGGVMEVVAHPSRRSSFVVLA